MLVCCGGSFGGWCAVTAARSSASDGRGVDRAVEQLRCSTSWIKPSGWKIDFILRKNRAFSRDEFARRIPLDLLGVPVYAASAEDTIVAKLEWSKQSGGSDRQRRDVAGIIATMGDQLDRAYIERWVLDLDLQEEWKSAPKASV